MPISPDRERDKQLQTEKDSDRQGKLYQSILCPVFSNCCIVLFVTCTILLIICNFAGYSSLLVLVGRQSRLKWFSSRIQCHSSGLPSSIFSTMANFFSKLLICSETWPTFLYRLNLPSSYWSPPSLPPPKINADNPTGTVPTAAARAWGGSTLHR